MIIEGFQNVVCHYLKLSRHQWEFVVLLYAHRTTSVFTTAREANSIYKLQKVCFHNSKEEWFYHLDSWGSGPAHTALQVPPLAAGPSPRWLCAWITCPRFIPTTLQLNHTLVALPVWDCKDCPTSMTSGPGMDALQRFYHQANSLLRMYNSQGHALRSRWK